MTSQLACYWLHKVGGWYRISIRYTRRKHDTGFSIRPVVFVTSYCIQIIYRYIINVIHCMHTILKEFFPTWSLTTDSCHLPCYIFWSSRIIECMTWGLKIENTEFVLILLMQTLLCTELFISLRLKNIFSSNKQTWVWWNTQKGRTCFDPFYRKQLIIK